MSAKKSFRLILWSISSTGWRGDQKAVVYDAKSIGLDEQANDSGSAYWTLDNDHPQIAEFVPLARHYEISRYSEARSRWEFVGAGMLNDYNVTEYQTTFSGIDYKSVLNQVYTPLTGLTTSNASAISDKITGNGVSGGIATFNITAATATSALRHIDTSVISVSGPNVTAFPGTVRQISVDEYTALYANTIDGEGLFVNVNWRNTGDETITYWTTPQINLNYGFTWNSSTITGFQSNPPMVHRVYVSPPGYKDAGYAPIDNTGLIGEMSDATLIDPPGAMTNGTTWGTYSWRLLPQELADAIQALPDPAGLSPDGNAYFEGSGDIIPSAMPDLVDNPNGDAIACLRPGVSYSFQIYGAIFRSFGNGIWYRTNGSAITGSSDPLNPTFGTAAQVTLGQGTENARTLISRVFTEAVVNSDSANSRLRYASLSISGSTTTTHVTFSAGEPVLDHIASVCDLEMGAKTNGDKVVFGIDKPTGGSSYAGNFKLNLSVSSSASTAMALRYPDNIRSFSFTPGYSRVRNDITIIPTTAYLSGASGQNVSGASLIGATAVDQSSITANGRIPLIAPKANLVDSKAAQNEANRLLETYKVANSKQVNIRAVLDGVDLWNGWDVGDSVKLTVNRGLAVVDEPFVITGVRWFGESDGHERIELDLMQGTAFSAAYAAPIPTTEAS